MQRDHKREGPVALGHELPRGQRCAEGAIHAPEIAAASVGPLAALRQLEFVGDRRNERGEIREERCAARTVRDGRQEADPRAKRRKARGIKRSRGPQRRKALREALRDLLERRVEHGHATDGLAPRKRKLREDLDRSGALDLGQHERHLVGIRHLVLGRPRDGDEPPRRVASLHAGELDRLDADLGWRAGDDGARRDLVAATEEELLLLLPVFVHPAQLAVGPCELRERGVVAAREEVAREAVEAAARALTDDGVVGEGRDEPVEPHVARREIAAVGRRRLRGLGGRGAKPDGEREDCEESAEG